MALILKWLIESILGNLLAAALIFAGGVFLRNFVPAILRRAAYRGQKIAGNWTSNFVLTDEDLQGEEDIVLKQSGHKIKGTIYTRIKAVNRPMKRLDSIIIAEFRDDYLVGYYVPKSDDAFGTGAFTMQLLEGGKTLKGFCEFQYTRDRSLRRIEYEWLRQKT